jgi:peptide chain release factor 1
MDLFQMIILRAVVQVIKSSRNYAKEATSAVNKAIPDIESLNRCQMEFTCGVGGTEAMLFTSEICEMYRLLCAKRGWEWLVLENDNGPNGGLRSALVAVNGPRSYANLRFEAGTHRVQRAPVTDKSRIHTSTASVSVMPEPEEVTSCLMFSIFIQCFSRKFLSIQKKSRRR